MGQGSIIDLREIPEPEEELDLRTIPEPDEEVDLRAVPEPSPIERAGQQVRSGFEEATVALENLPPVEVSVEADTALTQPQAQALLDADTANAMTALEGIFADSVIQSEKERGIIRALAEDFVAAGVDIPKRLGALAQTSGRAFLRTFSDPRSLFTEEGFKNPLRREFEELTPEQRERVVGGAIDLALILIPGGKIGQAAGKLVAKAGPKGAELISREVGKGATGGALFADPEAPADFGQRVVAGTLGAATGGALTTAGRLFDRLAGPKAQARREIIKFQRGIRTALKDVDAQEIAGELSEVTAKDLRLQLQRLSDDLDAREKFVIEDIRGIERRGTVGTKAGKPPRRAIKGLKEKTRKIAEEFATPGKIKVNDESIARVRQELIGTVKTIEEQIKAISTRQIPKGFARQMQTTRQRFEGLEELFFVERETAGKSLAALQVGLDELDRLANQALVLGLVHNRPTLVNVALQNIGEHGFFSTEAGGSLGELGVAMFRRGVFPTMSFLRDSMTNIPRLGSEMIQDVLGTDLTRALTGKPGFERTRALMYTLMKPHQVLIDRFSPSAKLNRALDPTALGERFAPVFGRSIDKVPFFALSLKTAMDSINKRFGLLTGLRAEALLAAKKNGIKAAEMKSFMDDFLANPPADVAERAMKRANDFGFNRELSKVEQSLANNRAIQVLASPFPRWQFQFTRFIADHTPLGAIPLKKSGQLKNPEELSRLLIRNLEGLGALALIDNLVTDHVNFDTMEYDWGNGVSTPIGNIAGLPELVAMSTVLRIGDDEDSMQKFLKAMSSTSVVIGPFASGPEGILSRWFETAARLQESPMSAQALMRESERVFQAISGQAALSMLTRLVDEGERSQGFLASLPIEALPGSPLKRPVVDPVGGDVSSRVAGPIKLGRHTIPFTDGWADIGIPFATIRRSPLHQKMVEIGMSPYPARKAIGEYKAEAIPTHMQSFYDRAYGLLFGYMGSRTMRENLELFNNPDLRGVQLEELSKARRNAQNMAEQAAIFFSTAKTEDTARYEAHVKREALKELLGRQLNPPSPISAEQFE